MAKTKSKGWGVRDDKTAEASGTKPIKSWRLSISREQSDYTFCLFCLWYILKCFCCCSATNSYLFVTPCTAAHQASQTFTISWSLIRLMSFELVMPSNHLTFCHPLLLPSIFPNIRVFSNELALHLRWPKYWSFSISPFNEYSGLISFRIYWFDLLAVQGTLRSLL